MQTRIEVSSKVLDWLIMTIPIDYMTDNILSSIKQWKNGEVKPTFNQLENISRKLGVPFGYFFLEDPPKEDLSLVEYRTVDSVNLQRPSRDLIATMHDMEQIQEWTYNYLIAQEFEKLEYVGSQKNSSKPTDIADYIRNILGLSIDWYSESKTAVDSFKSLRSAISNIGVIVMMNGIVGNNTRRSLRIDEFRAFAIVNEYAPLIFINSNDSINGKLFSLLHEFVHICIGENSLYNDRFSEGQKVSKTEVICNAVSAEILVPMSSFVCEWNSEIKNSDANKTISVLAKLFRCGETVIARRALDKGFITYSDYNSISKNSVKKYIEAKQNKGSAGGDYYRNIANKIDNRFLGMLVNSLNEGKTLYTDAFRLTNTNRTTFKTLVEKVGGVV